MAVLVLAAWCASTMPVRADTSLVVEVTSTGDGPGACPHPTNCTLRKAIETVNADSSSGAAVIVFNSTVFAPGAPATIAVQGSALPPITRTAATIDGSNAGVRIDGSALPTTPAVDGIVLQGAQTHVEGVAVHHFPGACIVLGGADSVAGGDSTARRGVTVGYCRVGIVLRGTGAMASGSRVGFAAGSDASAPVVTGVMIAAANGTVGDPGGGRGLVNAIGHADVGIAVGEGTGTAFAGTRVLRNLVGTSFAGEPAPVGVGIELRAPSTGSTVSQNTIANSRGAGIRLPIESGGAAATRARLTGNRFEALGGMAIDLKGDGATNANDDGDGDTGPNELINHPVIERATRTTISGSAGATCANCTVELYLATHVPGGNDQGSLPTGAVASTDSQGRFTFANHGVATGQWVTAIVSDANGNTSEFGPSARVGTGQLQCEPETLAPGWQHVAFLGSEPTILGDSYPAGDGRVSAIYALTDGSTAFRRWLTGAEAGRTLTTLDPGEAYWMLVTSSFTPEGGFSLGAALSVALGPGWNDFVYFGPTADVRDALETIAGRYSDVFRFVPDSAGGHWMNWGGEGAPTWARGFAQMEACQVYQVFMTAAGTLTPPQP